MNHQALVATKIWMTQLAILAIILTVGPFISSRLSGWNSLVRRFRANEPWSGESWGWQSMRFRGWWSYNHCLRVGATQESLYVSIFWLFRLFHPALVIPWREIEMETEKMFFGLFETAQLRIGSEERVNVRIYGKLVGRLRQAAGPGWPLYQTEQQTRIEQMQSGQVEGKWGG